MTDINIFPTPIFVGQNIDTTIDNILSESNFLSFLEKNKHWDCVVETSYFNKNRVLSEASGRLKDAISRLLFPFVVNYIRPISIKKDLVFELNNFWVNRYVEGSFQEQHSHSDSIISFVYMHKTTPSHSVLRFHNKDVYTVDDFAQRSGVQFSSLYEDIDLSQGEFVLFPSFLPHSVVPQNADGERITLSGNIKIHLVQQVSADGFMVEPTLTETEDNL